MSSEVRGEASSENPPHSVPQYSLISLPSLESVSEMTSEVVKNLPCRFYFLS